MEDAIEWWDKAERISPTNFWPYYLRATAHLKHRDLQSALAQFRVTASKCKGHVTRVEYDNIIKTLSDVRSLLAQPDQAALAEGMSLAAGAGRPLVNCARLALVKDEDIIYANLASSYQVGFRYFAIADNSNTDGTRNEINRFMADHSDCIIFVVTDPVVGQSS